VLNLETLETLVNKYGTFRYMLRAFISLHPTLFIHYLFTVYCPFSALTIDCKSQVCKSVYIVLELLFFFRLIVPAFSFYY